MFTIILYTAISHINKWCSMFSSTAVCYIISCINISIPNVKESFLFVHTRYRCFIWCMFIILLLSILRICIAAFHYRTMNLILYNRKALFMLCFSYDVSCELFWSHTVSLNSHICKYFFFVIVKSCPMMSTLRKMRKINAYILCLQLTTLVAPTYLLGSQCLLSLSMRGTATEDLKMWCDK